MQFRQNKSLKKALFLKERTTKNKIMKRIMGLIGSIMLFGWSMAWAGGRNALYEPPAPDSLEAVWHYTEGLKKLHIEADTSASVALMERAVEEIGRAHV